MASHAQNFDSQTHDIARAQRIRRRLAGMSGQQTREKTRLTLEQTQRPAAKRRMTPEKKQQARDSRGGPHDAAVSGGVGIEIAGSHGIGERKSLLQSEAKTLAGNAVHSTGSVANQRDGAGPHRASAIKSGDASQLGRNSTSARKTGGDAGNGSQSVSHSKMRIARE